MAKSRLVGSYPVIGIRPTIDGRRSPRCKRISGRSDYEHGQIRSKAFRGEPEIFKW